MGQQARRPYAFPSAEEAARHIYAFNPHPAKNYDRFGMAVPGRETSARFFPGLWLSRRWNQYTRKMEDILTGFHTEEYPLTREDLENPLAFVQRVVRGEQGVKLSQFVKSILKLAFKDKPVIVLQELDPTHDWVVTPDDIFVLHPQLILDERRKPLPLIARFSVNDKHYHRTDVDVKDRVFKAVPLTPAAAPLLPELQAVGGRAYSLLDANVPLGEFVPLGVIRGQQYGHRHFSEGRIRFVANVDEQVLRQRYEAIGDRVRAFQEQVRRLEEKRDATMRKQQIEEVLDACEKGVGKFCNDSEFGREFSATSRFDDDRIKILADVASFTNLKKVQSAYSQNKVLIPFDGEAKVEIADIHQRLCFEILSLYEERPIGPYRLTYGRFYGAGEPYRVVKVQPKVSQLDEKYVLGYDEASETAPVLLTFTKITQKRIRQQYKLDHPDTPNPVRKRTSPAPEEGSEPQRKGRTTPRVLRWHRPPPPNPDEELSSDDDGISDISAIKHPQGRKRLRSDDVPISSQPVPQRPRTDTPGQRRRPNPIQYSIPPTSSQSSTSSMDDQQPSHRSAPSPKRQRPREAPPQLRGEERERWEAANEKPSSDDDEAPSFGQDDLTPVPEYDRAAEERPPAPSTPPRQPISRPRSPSPPPREPRLKPVSERRAPKRPREEPPVARSAKPVFNGKGKERRDDDKNTADPGWDYDMLRDFAFERLTTVDKEFAAVIAKPTREDNVSPTAVDWYQQPRNDIARGLGRGPNYAHPDAYVRQIYRYLPQKFVEAVDADDRLYGFSDEALLALRTAADVDTQIRYRLIEVMTAYYTRKMARLPKAVSTKERMAAREYLIKYERLMLGNRFARLSLDDLISWLVYDTGLEDTDTHSTGVAALELIVHEADATWLGPIEFVHLLPLLPRLAGSMEAGPKRDAAIASLLSLVVRAETKIKSVDREELFARAIAETLEVLSGLLPEHRSVLEDTIVITIQRSVLGLVDLTSSPAHPISTNKVNRDKAEWMKLILLALLGVDLKPTNVWRKQKKPQQRFMARLLEYGLLAQVADRGRRSFLEGRLFDNKLFHQLFPIFYNKDTDGEDLQDFSHALDIFNSDSGVESTAQFLDYLHLGRSRTLGMRDGLYDGLTRFTSRKHPKLSPIALGLQKAVLRYGDAHFAFDTDTLAFPTTVNGVRSPLDVVRDAVAPAIDAMMKTETASRWGDDPDEPTSGNRRLGTLPLPGLEVSEHDILAITLLELSRSMAEPRRSNDPTIERFMERHADSLAGKIVLRAVCPDLLTRYPEHVSRSPHLHPEPVIRPYYRVPLDLYSLLTTKPSAVSEDATSLISRNFGSELAAWWKEGREAELPQLSFQNVKLIIERLCKVENELRVTAQEGKNDAVAHQASDDIQVVFFAGDHIAVIIEWDYCNATLVKSNDGALPASVSNAIKHLEVDKRVRTGVVYESRIEPDEEDASQNRWPLRLREIVLGEPSDASPQQKTISLIFNVLSFIIANERTQLTALPSKDVAKLLRALLVSENAMRAIL